MYQLDFSKPCSVYFVGIGGISMSGLAEILADEGFKVSGSDWKQSEITERLESKGIHVEYGESAAHVPEAVDVAVLTSAVKDTNLELTEIRRREIPTLTRAQLLGQLMRNYKTAVAVSGTHGKTTTTSMISEIMMQAGTDPTLSIGGIYKSAGGNIRVGGSEMFVTEACEYTNSFLSFYPTIGIILNIEEDHLDFFQDLADIRHSFRKFAELLPADGCLIISGDIDRYKEISGGLSCRVVTYSMNGNGDYTPADITYDDLGHASFMVKANGQDDARIALHVPGIHNVSNALAAVALADVCGIDRSVTVKALGDFTGTDRRFEYKGEIGGVKIIDDYAHHPTEIAATLAAAQKVPHKTLWCVFQPHTYTRTKAFMDEFAKALSSADHVVLADIYAAREKDTLGISSADLQKRIRALGRDCEYFPTFDEIENYLLQNCTKGDLLITMGAGDVVKIGENLLGN